MKILVTGASGFVGSAVVTELKGGGHDVVGLARSDAAAAKVAAAGAAVVRGDIDDHAAVVAAARDVDGVVHLAHNHDFVGVSRVKAGADDAAVVSALGAVLVGKPLVITSGLHALREDEPAPPTAPRAPAEQAVRSLCAQGVRGVIVRLPPSVHGDGDYGFVPMLIDIARKTGTSAYIDDGSHRWSAVHQRDAARLYRLAVERAPAGSVLHAIGDAGVPTRALAEVIGRRLGVPVTSVARKDAADHFGWLGGFFGRDVASSAPRAGALGFAPREIGWLADVDSAAYFPPAT